MIQSHAFSALFVGAFLLGASICHVIDRKSFGLKVFEKENWVGRGILGGWCGHVFFVIYGN